MADNYLENKMEDYRRSTRKVRSSVFSTAGCFRLKMPSLRVFMAGVMDGFGTELVSRYSALGCKVIFCHEDAETGRGLAQRCGGLFFPSLTKDGIDWCDAFDFALDRWGGVDLLISNRQAPCLSLFGESRLLGVRIIELNQPQKIVCSDWVGLSFHEDSNLVAVINTVLFLSLPENRCISNQIIRIGN